MVDIRIKLAMIQTFLETFRAAARKRKQRREPVGNEAGWIVFERNTMHKAVNQERAKLNKKPLELEEVMRVERSAVGHSDYDSKFALGCTELVLDKE